MKCPRCGETNEEGFRFCRSCGGALPASKDAEATAALIVQPVTGAPTPSHRLRRAGPPTEPPATYKLVCTLGILADRTYTIDGKGLTIGRDPTSCQVVVADDEISRLHAWIGFNDRGEVVLRDSRSANGSYVNRVRVQERVLRSRDEICFGTSRRHLFRMEEMPPASSGRAAREQSAAVRPLTDGTSVLNPAELAAARQEDRAAAGTVKMKVTALMARPHLELIVDKYAVRTLDIPDAGMAVGRDGSRCSLVMEHPSVSGVHAELAPKDGKVLLTDRSTNGTFVNGLRMSAAELRDGDYITFGRYSGKSLIFRTGLEPELKIEKVDLTKDRITIGRDPSSDVSIDHPLVSKKHAEILRESGKVFIVDLGSTNGTFVNGIKIRRHQLQEMDRIVIGPSELHFSGESLSRTHQWTFVRVDAQNATFEVADRGTGQPKLLLDDISLVVKPRELIGLLGPSGAGKTTLMNVLNGFQAPSRGQVLYNGADLYQNLDTLKTTIGFVPQEDIVHKQLSVRRCLYYAAQLRLPEDLSEEEINRRIEEMLEVLKIDPQCWDNPVATLSGGQRKRVSIGIELLPKPGVLFLDEPTAGLDPRTETLMMMLFRQLANQGSTIVVTTHLLASFGVLDKVVVLVQGRLAFYGPGTRFLDYFKAEAPPDVYDDLTDNNTVSYAQELKKRFSDSDLYREVIAQPLKQAEAGKTQEAPPATAKGGGTGFSLHQFRVLVRRAWELRFGDRAQALLLFLQAPLVAGLVALMAEEPNQIQTIFMGMFAALWFGCSNSVREIVDERTIYRRERQTGLKIPPYVLSKLLVLSIVDLAQCVSVAVVLLFATPAHPALSLSPPEILGAVAILFLVAVNGSLIGLVISSAVNSPDKALTLFPLVLIPELLLSGLFMPVGRIPTVIPVTAEQVLAGKMFAQPEVKRKAQEMKRSAEEASAEETVKKGESGQSVVGAIQPSTDVQKAFHHYTPQPVEGMPAPARWLSALAVSRWGLEALSDLCIHGAHSTQNSAYKIINTVYISRHPDDLQKLEAGLEAGPETFAASGSFPLPSRFWRDKGPYLTILAGYAALMTAVVLILIKRKDAA